MFVHRSSLKAGAAYKFALPFCGPFRIVELHENGATLLKVARPGDPKMRVALNRLHRCPREIEEVTPDSGCTEDQRPDGPISTSTSIIAGTPPPDVDDHSMERPTSQLLRAGRCNSWTIYHYMLCVLGLY